MRNRFFLIYVTLHQWVGELSVQTVLPPVQPDQHVPMEAVPVIAAALFLERVFSTTAAKAPRAGSSTPEM